MNFLLISNLKFLFFFARGSVSICSLGWLGTYYLVQAGIKTSQRSVCLFLQLLGLNVCVPPYIPLLFIIDFICICVDMHVPCPICGGLRTSCRSWFSPPSGFWGSNSGCQSWQQTFIFWVIPLALISNSTLWQKKYYVWFHCL